MAGSSKLLGLMSAVGSGDRREVSALLGAKPELAVSALQRHEEFFDSEHRAQVYAGDTALHVAAFAHDEDMVELLIACGSHVLARNRRGAEPLHAAMTGAPGSRRWNPQGQLAVIRLLIAAGADPNATASGGVTPLHRAVRNRCSAAVETLLELGADPGQRNDSGSTAMQLARWTRAAVAPGHPKPRLSSRSSCNCCCRRDALSDIDTASGDKQAGAKLGRVEIDDVAVALGPAT